MRPGFTIIELMIVLVLVGVFASLAAPSMTDLIAGAAVRGASSDFYASLLAARSEAIKRHANAVVAPIGSGWSTGWTVTVGGHVFQKADALSAKVAVDSDSTSGITYAMNGRVVDGAQTVIFYNAVNPAVTQARCVGVAPNGLPRVRVDGNHDSADGCN